MRATVQTLTSVAGRLPWTGPARLIDVLLTWQERATMRRHLAEMPDYMLRDVGLTRLNVAGEARKPFWRA